MTSPPEPASGGPRPAATWKDRALVVGFWTWAIVLVVATLAQLFHWKGALEYLDVKNWFSR